MNLDESIQSAIRHQQAGERAAAEKIYLEILEQHPEQPDALGMLATLALQKGDLDGAIDLLRRATVSRPDFADAHKNLGALLAKKGSLDQAIQSYQIALELRPADAKAHFDLANIFLARNQLDDAIAAYSKAVEHKPDFAEAYTRLGDALSRKGLAGDAAQARRRAEMVRPDYLERLRKISKTVWEKGRKEEAIAAYLREIGYKNKSPRPSSNPNQVLPPAPFPHAANRTPAQAQVDCIGVHAMLATVLAEMERFDEAAAAHACAAFLAPNAALTHEAMGKILFHQRDSVAAAQCFRKALAVNPNLVSSLNYLGAALRTLGQFDEAAACFEHMVQLRPDLAVGYSNLASIGKLDAEQTETRGLLALLEQPGLSVDDRIAVGFALGRAYDDAGRFDDAFAQYAMANSVAKRQRASAGEVYDRKFVDEHARLIVETFTAEFFRQRSDWGEPSELPVFVVGMPRSGTTLLQQIAASHPQVCGAGELRDILDIANSFRRADLKSDAVKLNPPKIKAAAQKHLQRLQAMDPKALRVIDKMPDNVYRLGLIALLFPKARVILCRRDPRDTCLSCFFQWFSIGNTFAFDLADCGHQHLATDRVAAHWRTHLPLPMMEMQYEELVADLEGQSRRLIEFLGLPWDPACLEFHRTETTVQTASVWQVRQPLYQSSVGRWRHYEKHLGPLLSELNRSPSAMK